MRAPGLIAFIAAAVLPAACTGSGARQEGVRTLEIGVVVSQTGEAAVYGNSTLAGIRLAVESINASGALGDTELAAVVRDDLSTVEGGRAAFDDLTGQGVPAIIGPTLSAVAADTDRIAQAAGIPVLAATNSTLDIAEFGDTVWRVSLAERTMLDASVGIAAEKFRVIRAALLSDPDEAYSSAAAGWFREAARRYGVRIVREAHFTTGGTDMGRALAQATAVDPEALLVPAYAAEARALLTEIARQDLPVQVIGGNGFNTPAVLRAATKTQAGLVVAASWDPRTPNPVSKEFIADYQAAEGSEPDAFAAQGHAAVEILLHAIIAGGNDPAGIEDGLRRLAPVQTVLGELTFSPGREAEYPPAVRIIRDGKLEPLVDAA